MSQPYEKWAIGKWMTAEPATVAPDCSVKAAFVKMKKEGYRHLLVVKDDKLLGIVSDRDLRRPESDAEGDDLDYFYRLDDDYDVSYVMTKDVKTIGDEDYIGKALGLFHEHKFGALPVVDKDGKVVGILSMYDVIRAFSRALWAMGNVVVPNMMQQHGESLLTSGPGVREGDFPE